MMATNRRSAVSSVTARSVEFTDRSLHIDTEESIFVRGDKPGFAYTLTLSNEWPETEGDSIDDDTVIVKLSVHDCDAESQHEIDFRVPYGAIDALAELFDRVIKSARQNGTLPPLVSARAHD